MDNKERLDLIVKSLEESKDKISNVKKEIIACLEFLKDKNKEVLNSIKDKKELIDLISDAIDKKIDTGIYDFIDGLFIKMAVKTAFDKIIDKVLGKDWFENLKK